MSEEHETLLDFYRSEQTSSETLRNERNESRLNDNEPQQSSSSAKTLSLFFASLCVIDLFGVFPIVALPRSIILCGT